MFILLVAMSTGPDTSKASSMSSTLEHPLACSAGNLMGDCGTLDSQHDSCGTLDSQHDSDVIVTETEQPHGDVVHEPGKDLNVHKQEPFGGDVVPRATVDDSEDGSASQQLVGSPVDMDGYDILAFDHTGEPSATLLDTGFGSDAHDQGFDWLLRLGEDETSGQSLCTERLGPDLQMNTTPHGSALPGLGVDSSKWALDVCSPKFFWETDPFLSGIFGQSEIQGPDLKRPAVAIDLTGETDTNVLYLLQKPKQTKLSGFCEQVIKHVEIHDDASKRHSIISNWTSLVCINLDSFSVGDAILAGSSKVTHADIEQSLRACFARKTTSTLAKRFYAMSRFVTTVDSVACNFFH